jgi:NAD-dependent deacetylase
MPLLPGHERRVLRLVNAATADELTRLVLDDPRFGSSSPRAYGIRATLAARIVAAREALPDHEFSSLAQVDAIFGMGPDTLHDLLVSRLVLPVDVPPELSRRLKAAKRVVVVTGAGVSASEVTPIPGDAFAQFWTPAAFVKDVEGTWDYLLARRDEAENATINEAHRILHALGQWVLKEEGSFTLVTQNQDRLHHHAADPEDEGVLPKYPIIELHGDVFHGRCANCGETFELPAFLAWNKPVGSSNAHKVPDGFNPKYFVCTECGGMARPNVLWLTEPYPAGTLDVAGAAVLAADVVLFMGTSGRVPAVRWLLHEAHWHASAFTAVLDTEAAAWRTRDGTPSWPGAPIVDEVMTGDIEDALASLQAAVGWPD